MNRRHIVLLCVAASLSLASAISNAATGRVKLIAAAAETRIPALPDPPTMREQGYDIGMWGYLWFAVVNQHG